MLCAYTITDEEFQVFRTLIRQEAGLALSESKRQLLCARLSKRLRHFGFQTLGQYYEYLLTRDETGAERVQMINCLTTNKTEFFREAHHFACLRTQVLPWVQQRFIPGTQKRLRLWCAGCSTGEEAYSLAISVREEMGRLKNWDIRILASDIDTNVLATAAEGLYSVDSMSHVPAEFHRKYFLSGRGEYQGSMRARPELRELITFRRINFIDDPWMIHTKFDAIFCRNVLIYFDRETQRRLCERFVTYLHSGGYLFLGHSESLVGLTERFLPLRGTTYRLRTDHTT